MATAAVWDNTLGLLSFVRCAGRNVHELWNVCFRSDGFMAVFLRVDISPLFLQGAFSPTCRDLQHNCCQTFCVYDCVVAVLSCKLLD